MTINTKAMRHGDEYGIVNLTKIREDLDRCKRSNDGDDSRFLVGVTLAYEWILSDGILVEEL